MKSLGSDHHVEMTARHLARLYVAMVGLRQQSRRALSLNQTEITALEFMRLHHPRPVRASDIAAFCGLSRSAVTKLLDQFEHDGRIVREPSDRDGRVVDVRIHPAFLDQIDLEISRLFGAVLPVLTGMAPASTGGFLGFLRDLTALVEQHTEARS